MFMQLFKSALAALLAFAIPHRVVYGGLCLLYLGACVGLDKAMISAAMALAYALLALR